MTDLEWLGPTTPANPAATPKKCRRHQWSPTIDECIRCGRPWDKARSRVGRNNRSRGNAAELDVARSVGGRKVGPLGHPWDVEMPGYARLQVRKYATPPSLRAVVRALDAIGKGGEEMAGYVWIEPGRGGEQLIVFRLSDFSERHGIPRVED